MANPFAQLWDNITSLGDAATQLAIRTCSEKFLDFVQNNLEIATGVGTAIATKSGKGLPEAFEALGEQIDLVWSEVSGRIDKFAWLGYASIQLQKGTFLASAANAGAWYSVTHEGCGGKRLTVSGSPQIGSAARAFGFMLAALASDNGIQNSAQLDEWHEMLKAQGMTGLDPVWKRIMAAYGNGVAMLAGQMPPQARTPLSRWRAESFGGTFRKRRTESGTAGPITRPGRGLGIVVAVIAAATLL